MADGEKETTINISFFNFPFCGKVQTSLFSKIKLKIEVKNFKIYFVCLGNCLKK